MSKPDTTVEIAFDAGVTGTPTWTDVTSYVRINPGADIGHWRGDEDSQAQPSQLSLTLKNDDGRFTPGNASSPLYPNVKKGRRIRVRSTLNGETFERFNGYIDDWRADWPHKVDWIAECQVTATSRTALLARKAGLKSIVEETVIAASPLAYYTLAEPADSASASDSSGNAQPSLAQSGNGAAVAFGSPGNDPGDLTAALFAGGKYLTSPAGGLTLVAAATGLSLNLSFSTTSTSVPLAYAHVSGETDVALNLNGSGQLTVGGFGSVAFTSTAAYNDGATHDLSLSYDAPNMTVAIDGVDLSTFGVVWSIVGTPDPVYLALGTGSSIPPTTVFTGTIAHAALWSAPISADTRAALGGSTDGFADETPAERLTRYGTFAGLASSDLDLDTGQAPDLAHIDTRSKTALAVMREVETTEGGVLFDALDGTLTFHDRAHRYYAGTPGYEPPGVGLPGGGPHGTAFTLWHSAGHIARALRPVLDDQQQVNDMTATNANGVTGRQFDQDSIDDHGLYRESLDLATTDPDEPLLRASWAVNRYAEPLTRVSEVEVLLNTLPDELAACVLEAQVGSIFTLADLPANAPSTVMHLFVEGRRESITGEEDRITFRTSPAEVFEVFTLGDPDRGLGSGYPLAY